MSKSNGCRNRPGAKGVAVPPCKRCGKTDSPQYAAHTDYAGICMCCVDELRANAVSGTSITDDQIHDVWGAARRVPGNAQLLADCEIAATGIVTIGRDEPDLVAAAKERVALAYNRGIR